MPSTTARPVVVVTGANEGIGYHMLDALRADGYRVAGLDIRLDALGHLADAHPERVLAVDCDLAEDEDVQAAIDAVVDEWGRIDILVNNAAVFDFGLFEDYTDDATRHEFAVNYFGALRAVRAVLPHMREQGGGIVHTMGSGVGQVGHPGLSGYASTKGAIEALTRSLRLELRHDPIHVTRLYPPMTGTRSARELGYPESMMADPTDVGRKLAGKIEATRPAIYADWFTRIGMALARRVPWLVAKGTERFLDPDATAESSPVEQPSA